MISLKKGAMFGLDARIALTIFTIISLMVSAHIYTIISELDVRKVLVESKTIGHAVDSYHKEMKASIIDTLDAGFNADETERYSFRALVENQNLAAAYSAKWHGPYLKFGYNNYKDPRIDKTFRLVSLSDSLSTTCNTTQLNKCYIFLKFAEVDSVMCSKFVDVSTSEQYSKVYTQSATGTNCNVFIKLTLDL